MIVMKIGFPAILFLVFLVLRLTSVIAWSWWWITAPLWGGIAVYLLFALTAMLIAAVSSIKK